jgi:hypothetical protein
MFLPESPRFWARKGDIEKATVALARVSASLIAFIHFDLLLCLLGPRPTARQRLCAGRARGDHRESRIREGAHPAGGLRRELARVLPGELVRWEQQYPADACRDGCVPPHSYRYL